MTTERSVQRACRLRGSLSLSSSGGYHEVCGASSRASSAGLAREGAGAGRHLAGQSSHHERAEFDSEQGRAHRAAVLPVQPNYAVALCALALSLGGWVGCGARSELKPGASAVLGDDAPDYGGVQCGAELICSVPEETCFRCGVEWEDSFCLPRDGNALEASWDRCIDTPYHWVEAQCDGPEDCPDGLHCVPWGAAIGSIHLRCGPGEGVSTFCHTDEDCPVGSSCVDDFVPFKLCAP